MSLTSRQKKLIHTGLVALVGVGTDIGVQLTNGSLNLTRAVIVGTVIGAVSRVVGAILAAMATTETL